MQKIGLRNVLKWTLVLVIVGTIAHTGRIMHSKLKAQEVRQGGPIPYTAILKESVLGADGTTKAGIEMTQAIRSDGSFALQVSYEPTEGGKNKKFRTIKFATGKEVTIDELAGTQSTIEKNVNPSRWQRDPNSKCINSFTGKTMVDSPQEVINGEEIIAGYRTIKILRNGATRWFALDYGCAMVKERMDWGSQGVSEKNLVALIAGEPQYALFQIRTTGK